MVAAEICSRLDRSAYDPMVLFMYPGRGSMPELLDKRGLPFHNLKRTKRRRVMGPFLPAFALRRLKIDLLHVHHIPLLMAIMPAAKLAGIHSVVFTEHAKFSISRSQKLQKACRTLGVSVDSFTTVSSDLKSYFVNELGIPAEAIAVVHNGVDTTRFFPGDRSEAIESLLPVDFTGKVLMTVGRLSEAKDHITLLSAVEILRKKGTNPYLIIVGDGELRQVIMREIEERRLSSCVRMAGRRSDIDQLLPGTDVFILSSKREGLPIAALEAMSAGLPVVATSVGGVPEAIRDEFNGLLVPPGDPMALAEAINRVCKDKALATGLGRNARKVIEEKFSLDKIAEKYSDIYQNILGGREECDHPWKSVRP